MSKNKCLISMLLCVVLVISTIIPTFATETPDIDTLMFQLIEYKDECKLRLQEGITGLTELVYTDESKEILRAKIKEVEQYQKAYYADQDSVTLEQMQAYTDELTAAVDSLVLEKTELEFLLLFVGEESNDNGYYSEKLWNDFTQKYAQAEAVYADETINDTRVTEAFWNLYMSFNNLCLSNMTPGDIDGDGKVTILDVTLLQKELVQMYTMNSSQIFVADVSDNNEIFPDINDATIIQKYTVKMVENDSWGRYLNELNARREDKWWDTNKLFQYAMRVRYWNTDIRPY